MKYCVHLTRLNGLVVRHVHKVQLCLSRPRDLAFVIIQILHATGSDKRWTQRSALRVGALRAPITASRCA